MFTTHVCIIYVCVCSCRRYVHACVHVHEYGCVRVYVTVCAYVNDPVYEHVRLRIPAGWAARCTRQAGARNLEGAC